VSVPIPGLVEPPFVASPRQNELAAAWADPRCRRLLAYGAVRSGKTQAACRLLVETALRYPCKYFVGRKTYRELADSTQRAMLQGDGPIAPLIPAEALKGQSLEKAWEKQAGVVTLANGAEFVFRSLEENAPGKVLGHTLGAALVDQAEEFRFDEGQELYEALISRCSDDRGPKKILLIANPAGDDHWLKERFITHPDRDERNKVIARAVHFTLFDNAANLDPEWVSDLAGTKDRRPAWYATYVLGLWGAIADPAYVVEEDHLVDDFPLDDSFDRFEAADYGLNGAPWCLWCVDYDGNLIAYDMLYEKDLLPSDLAPLIQAKRDGTWGESWAAFIDPSVWKRMGSRNRWGAPAMLADEFIDNGIKITPANNDPRAGLMRIRELLKFDETHRFPNWHAKAGSPGSPRIFFTSRVDRLVKELRSAPLQPDKLMDGGEKVEPVWEQQNGHAAAMCRYAVLTRPAPSTKPPDEELDPRIRLHMRLVAAEERPRGINRSHYSI
jgi:hypothetical protein